MNTVITFEQHTPFDEDSQKEIDKLQFSEIPEMRIVERNTGTEDEPIILKKIPFQANVSAEDFETLKSLLEQFGIVDIIGKWNDDGSKIEFSITKYRNALKYIQTFETAVFLNGVDFTDRENEFVPDPELDENDEPVFDIEENQIFLVPSRKTFTREKSRRIPTFAEAMEIQVNVFNNKFIRELSE